MTAALAITARLTKLSVRAWVAVGDQCGAVEVASGAEADLGGDLVADESDQPGERERKQMVDVVGVDEPVDGVGGGDAGADEDRGEDEVAGAFLGDERAQQERRAERDGGRCIAEVVDQVGEQRDAGGGDEQRELRGGGEHQHDEAERDDSQASL